MKKKYFKESIEKEFKNRSGIYLIQIAEHMYVGSTRSFYDRIQEHRKSLRKGKNENAKFQNTYNKYGEENCCWQILEECTISELLNREKWWIEHLNSDLNINKDPTKFPTNCLFNSDNGNSKKVYQYTLTGEFVKEYDSVQEACRQNSGFDPKGISLVASKHSTFNKSANGFQWSYTKEDKLPPYINNSAKAKIVSIYIIDCITGIESKFESIAEAARTLFPDRSDFDNVCACISASTKSATFIFSRYLARLENTTYNIPRRNSAIYDSNLDIIYQNAKEAEKTLGISAYKIKNKCKDESDTSLQYVGFCARVKLRESGEFLASDVEDNPNPSIIEI